MLSIAGKYVNLRDKNQIWKNLNFPDMFPLNFKNSMSETQHAKLWLIMRTMNSINYTERFNNLDYLSCSQNNDINF